MTVNGKINTRVCRGGIGRQKVLFKKIKVLTLDEEDVVAFVGSGTLASGPLVSGDDGGVMVQSRSI